MILSILAALERIDEFLPEAASTLGANPIQVLRHVILPLAVPDIAAGTTVVFCLSMSAYVTPAVLGGWTEFITTLIYNEFITQLNWPVGAALASLLLLISLSVVFGYIRFMSRLNVGSARPKHEDRFQCCDCAADSVHCRATSHCHFSVFQRARNSGIPPSTWSLRWYGYALSQPVFVTSAINSAWLAATATCISTPIALGAAMAIVRGRFAGKNLLQAALLSPLFVRSHRDEPRNSIGIFQRGAAHRDATVGGRACLDYASLSCADHPGLVDASRYDGGGGGSHLGGLAGSNILVCDASADQAGSHGGDAVRRHRIVRQCLGFALPYHRADEHAADSDLELR